MADDTKWVTINGAHVPIGKDGKPQFGREKQEARAKVVDRLKKVIDKKQTAKTKAKQKIAELVQRFRNGERIDLDNEIMEIDSRTLKAIKDLVGDDIDIATISLHLDELKHMEKRHGENGIANRDMNDIANYQDIIDILTDFDDKPKFGESKKGNIRYSKKYIDKDGQPAHEIEFKKNINNRKRLAILAIAKNKKRKGRLVSSYVENKKTQGH